ncbi:hypothetical protein AgCh_024567 [Apium graveolens]
MSPEYATGGIFSAKSDVYSFGAWRIYTDGKMLDLLDEVLAESSHGHEIEVFRAIEIGLLCVQHYPADRPTMATVVLMLTSEISLPQPKEPGFFTDTKLHKGASSSPSSTM